MRFHRCSRAIWHAWIVVIAGCAGMVGGRNDGGSDGPRPPVRCAGQVCALGTECCFLTGQCFDPANHAACPNPSTSGDGGVLRQPDGAIIMSYDCGSNADCPPGTVCENSACLGVGRCAYVATLQCDPRPNSTVCGCDGVSYVDHCAAEIAGVRYTTGAACGQPDPNPYPGPNPTGSSIGCGFDSQCPSGQICCQSYGRCVDPACADCCPVPLPGTQAGCRNNDDCYMPQQQYCWSPQCTGPGGCVPRYTLGCSGGVSLPVCGCNGMTYINACWAAGAGMRVAHDGPCP